MAEDRKKCPYCDEEISINATKCRYCGSMLETQSTAPYDTLDLPLVGTPTAADRLLSDRYRIVRELGRGGMGVVYLAHDEELDMDVAVKLLPVELANDSRALEQLRSEAKLSMSLSHPNIMRLHNLDTSGQLKFIAMEYVNGPDLLELLREKERLPLEESLPIIKAICDGLDYAHSRRVLHRDLKPANIMMTSKGEVKITDFGIARRMRESMSKLSQKTISGTPAYMAPEHIMGEHLTTQSDIYSLGAVVYELLSGHPPFYQGDISTQIRFKDPPPIAGVPEQVNDAIIKALAKSVDDRPATAAEFYKSLTCASAIPEPQRLAAPPAAREIPKPRRSSPRKVTPRVIEPAVAHLPEAGPDKGIPETRKKPEEAGQEPLPPQVSPPTAPLEQPKEVQERWQKLLKEADIAYQATSWRKAFYLFAKVPVEFMNDRQKERFAALREKSLSTATTSKPRLRLYAAGALIIAVVVAISLLWAFSPSKRALSYLGSGKAKLEEDDKQGAMEDFNKAIELDPRLAEAYYQRGRLREYGSDDAMQDFTKAIELNPKYYEAYVRRGGMKHDMGDYDGAIVDCTKAIAINPNYANAYCGRGVARSKKGDVDGAIADYDKAIEINPKFALAYLNRGVAKAYKGDLDGAIADFTKAIELNPKYADAYYFRGLARDQKGDLDGAIADFTKAIEIDPTYADGVNAILSESYYNRGVVRAKKDDLDGAIADFTKASEIDPTYAGAYCNRGVARAKKDDLDGAIADWTKAIEIDPKYAMAYYNRGFARKEKGDLDGAIADYTKAIEINPKFYLAYYFRGIAHKEKSDLASAVEDYEEFLRLAPNHALAKYAKQHIADLKKQLDK